MERVALPLAKISGLTADTLLFSPARIKPQFWQEFVHELHAGVKLAESLCQFPRALTTASGSLRRADFKRKAVSILGFI